MDAPARSLRALNVKTSTDRYCAALAGPETYNASGLFSLANMDAFLATLSPEQQATFAAQLRPAPEAAPFAEPPTPSTEAPSPLPLTSTWWFGSKPGRATEVEVLVLVTLLTIFLGDDLDDWIEQAAKDADRMSALGDECNTLKSMCPQARATPVTARSSHRGPSAEKLLQSKGVLVYIFERLAEPTRALERGRPAASWPGTPHMTARKGRK